MPPSVRTDDDDDALDFVLGRGTYASASASPPDVEAYMMPLLAESHRWPAARYRDSWWSRLQAAIGAGGAGSGARSRPGVPHAKLRAGKLKWAIVLALLVAYLIWNSGRSQQPQTPDSDAGGFEEDLDPRPLEPLGRAPPVFDAHPPVPGRPASNQEKEQAAEVVDEDPAQQAAAPASRGPIDVDVDSAQTTPSSPRASERFLTYMPHSGYHNQRISLENALTLAFMLDRTLLVPPVWLGHAIPYIAFDKLQRRLEMANKAGLEHCIPFGNGANDEPIPRECDGFWDWTTVDWNFLVDLSEAERLVPIRRRGDMSMAWLERELGLAKPKKGKGGETRSDVYELRDETMYQYRFYDSPDDQDPLEKWQNRVDVDQFRKDTDEYKLVQVGSLFGTSRLRVMQDHNADARSTFRKAMVFHTEAVDRIVEQIRDRLGGAGRYYGLHLRVGDGVFLREAAKNMRDVWDKLCVDKMKVDRAVCDELRTRAEGQRPLARRDAEGLPAGSGSDRPTLTKRANSRPQREGAYHHAPLPPLPVIRDRTDSPLAASLTCRGPLHTNARFLPFNAPLFLATDSKLPDADPNLAVFFAAFPCTFTLADFAALPALGELNRLRSARDKTPLAQFLYPQLDAQVAAWGRGLVGTPQSTYSRFAIDVLHQVYQCVSLSALSSTADPKFMLTLARHCAAGGTSSSADDRTHLERRLYSCNHTALATPSAADLRARRA